MSLSPGTRFGTYEIIARILRRMGFEGWGI
jgi:hypothetical protein